MSSLGVCGWECLLGPGPLAFRALLGESWVWKGAEGWGEEASGGSTKRGPGLFQLGLLLGPLPTLRFHFPPWLQAWQLPIITLTVEKGEEAPLKHSLQMCLETSVGPGGSVSPWASVSPRQMGPEPRGTLEVGVGSGACAPTRPARLWVFLAGGGAGRRAAGSKAGAEPRPPPSAGPPSPQPGRPGQQAASSRKREPGSC